MKHMRWQLIIKDLKSAVIRPTMEYIQKTSMFLIIAYKNFKSQVNPELQRMISAQDRKVGENIDTMYALIGECEMYKPVHEDK